jgi:hypothetical protein
MSVLPARVIPQDRERILDSFWRRKESKAEAIVEKIPRRLSLGEGHAGWDQRQHGIIKSLQLERRNQTTYLWRW